MYVQWFHFLRHFQHLLYHDTGGFPLVQTRYFLAVTYIATIVSDAVIIVSTVMVLLIGSSGDAFAASTLRGLRFFQVSLAFNVHLYLTD